MGKKKRRPKLKAVKGLNGIKVKMKKKKKHGLNKRSKQPAAQNKPERDTKGRLLPGSSGNPEGRPKGRYSLTTILMDLLSRKVPGKSKQTQGELLMKTLLKYAKKGNSKLLALALERIDGKVPDRLFTTETNPLSDIDEAKLNQIINAGGDETNEPAAE